MQNCRYISLAGGPLPYDQVLTLQRTAQAARQRGDIPDTVYLLEHEPVITIGRSASGDANVKTSSAELARRGILLLETDRGGDVTYHGPGQLVAYPIIDLSQRGRDLHKYLRSLEFSVIDLLHGLDIEATTISGLTGVWVDDKKVAAIGIKVSRWVTLHGISINNDLDLSPMRDDIVACGIADHDVTSLREVGLTIDRDELEQRLMKSLCKCLLLCGDYRRICIDEAIGTIPDPSAASEG